MRRKLILALHLLIAAQFSAHAIPKQIRNTTAEHVKPLAPFYVPNGTVNLALGKSVSASDDRPAIGTLDMITDGEKEASEGNWVEIGPGVQWVQIDLGQPARIFGIQLWHYFGETRVYRDVVVRVADDADFVSNVRTLYNSDRDNSSGLGIGIDKEFYESHYGFRLDTRGKNYEGITARYVRFYSNGNTSDKQNQYIEVEVIGKALVAPGRKAKTVAERVAASELKPWKYARIPSQYRLENDRFVEVPRKQRTLPLQSPFLVQKPFYVPADAAVIGAGVISSSAKPVSASRFNIRQPHPLISELSFNRWTVLPPGLQWMQLDLRKPQKLYAIRLWHFLETGRVYHDVIVQTAADARFTQNVRTLFNNDTDNSAGFGKGLDKEYVESEDGLLIDARGANFAGVTTRFVRFYSRGNSSNAFNHYTALEIIGAKLPIHPLGRPDLMLWETPLPHPFYV